MVLATSMVAAEALHLFWPFTKSIWHI